ncbi:hypothetical protein BGW41_006836 [Actinomortierella wolfii]|nr:hypothetical protein BGW41_006836 [Actinomortierella wolfii]
MHFAITATTLLSVAISAATASPIAKHGQIVAIENSNDWCMMMPPTKGGHIAPSEVNAIAFCTKNMKDAPGAQVFPAGFIQSAHFKSGDHWVQVTGLIDRSKYDLDPQDEGGQYDIKSPVGSACAKYNYFVNLIEPSDNRYCIRCCRDKEDCDTSKSTYGCEEVVPGDYSGPTTPVEPTSGSARPTNTATHSAAPTVAPTSPSTLPGPVPTGSNITTTPVIPTANDTAVVLPSGTITGTPVPTHNAATARRPTITACFVTTAAVFMAGLMAL